ncbi:hypothetical protein MO973_42725 [Paenibacillus sp. TRM 82003]|nr:hypothetical protein [Paenibacillus sp. TRM 82003]
MNHSTLRTLGVGQMLDRSFQVYRKLFSPLFLMTLVAFGPFYLLSNLLVVNLGALPIVPEFTFDDFDRFWDSRFPTTWFEGGLELWAKIVGILLLALVLLFLVIPVYFAATVALTNRTLDGEAPTLADAFKDAWRRYGRVLGNSVLFMLVSIGVYMVAMTVNMFLSLIYGSMTVSTAALGGTEAGAASVLFLVVYVIFAYGSTLVYYYFLIRFAYFLPPLLFENESVGLGRSWSVTRRGFWRLLAVYFIYTSLIYVFSIALGFVFVGFGVSVAGLLLTLVVFCALIPIGLVIYTVTYRVQKARNDADDVEALLTRLRPAPARGADGEAGLDGGAER